LWRYSGATLGGVIVSANPCWNHSPRRCARALPCLSHGSDRHSFDDTHASESTSNILIFHCGYSFARLPTSPMIPAWTGRTSFPKILCVRLVINVHCSFLLAYSDFSRAFIMRK